MEKEPSPLRDMTAVERMVSDYAGTGMTIGPHPMALKHRALSGQGVTPAERLHRVPSGRTVRVAGTVIVRQRPMTAKGFLFVSLEDETGIANIIVRPKMFDEHRLLLMGSSFLLVEGVLQNQEGVVSVRAERFEALEPFEIGVGSHDFG